MTKLTNPVTGHELEADDAAVDFWKAAGYRDADPKAAKKAPAKKASSSKKSSK